MENKFDLSTVYSYSVINPENGEVVDSGNAKNLVTKEGRAYILNKSFKNSGANYSWYIGLKNSTAPSYDDTNTFHSWSDITDSFDSMKQQFYPGNVEIDDPNTGSTSKIYNQSVLMVNRSGTSKSVGGFFLTTKRSAHSGVVSMAYDPINSTFISVVDNGLGICLRKATTSDSGNSWVWEKLTDHLFYNQINKIKYLDGKFFIVGSNGYWAYSADLGTNWTQLPSPTVPINIYGIAARGSVLYICGDQGKIYKIENYESPASITFTLQEYSQGTPNASRSYYDIDIVGTGNYTKYIAVGGGGMYAYKTGNPSTSNDWVCSVTGEANDLYSVSLSLDAASGAPGKVLVGGISKIYSGNWSNWSAGVNLLTSISSASNNNYYNIINLPITYQWVIVGKKEGVSVYTMSVVNNSSFGLSNISGISGDVYCTNVAGNFIFILGIYGSNNFFNKISLSNNAVPSDVSIDDITTVFDPPLPSENFDRTNVLYGVAHVTPSITVGSNYVLAVTATLKASG